jgi:putative copper export protein
MGKHLIKWSYWLGAVLVLLALAARVLNAKGMNILFISTRGNPITYRTFLDGALFFFVLSIATANYIGLKSREHQP